MIATKKSIAIAMLASVAFAAPVAVSAQQETDASINVYGSVPSDLSGMAEGPEIEGFISARRGNEMTITRADGSSSMVLLSPATEIRGKGGFLGLNKTEIAANSLYNGVPVTVKTVGWDGGLIASRVNFKNSDYETAAMIHNGTSQQFALHSELIEENAAATEALRGRVANIDNYNIKGTTNVYFDSGKWNLTPAAQAELCSAASQAGSMDNALLLVVGYTDSQGDPDFNQELSEKRAGRVVNFLQQQCSWEPWRMLTPTGMSESDPTADNSTPEGRAQNRRVAVNILVSKAVDGA